MRTPLSSIAHLAARTGRRAAALLVALALLVSIVPATLAAGSPTGNGFEWLATPPSSIAVGALESDALMRVFAERTDFALTRDVAVDFTEPGTYTQVGDLAPTTIEAGTIVNSYYIHADQTDTRANVAVVATITFPDPIIGVILTDGRLSASKDVLGVAGIDYPTSGYELIGGCPSTQDCATLSEDRHSLTLRTTIYNVTDDLRVLTRGAQYAICPLYDQDKAHRLGSTVPIKLQLCDAAGTNLSAAGIVVQATGLTKQDNTVSAVEDSGSANSPDDNFRYDATLGGDGGYIYNLSTKGLSTGTWVLSFTVDGDDDGTYTVRFDVK